MSTSLLYDVSTISRNLTFSLNNTTADAALFTINGPIVIITLWGITTVALSSSHTNAHFRLTSGAGVTNLVGIGVNLSGNPVDTGLFKLSNSGTILSEFLKTTGSYTESNVHATTPQIVNLPSGQTSMTVAYRHTTTNTPESGAINFTMVYMVPPGASTTVALA